MRYAIVAASLLAGCICWADISKAQEACVSAPNGAIVCGPIVQPNFGQPNYGPPTRPNYAPRRNFEERRDYDDERRGERPDEGRDRDPRGGPNPCARYGGNYTLQDGECRPYVRR